MPRDIGAQVQQMLVADHINDRQPITAIVLMPDDTPVDVLNRVRNVIPVRFHRRAELLRGRIIKDVFSRQWLFVLRSCSECRNCATKYHERGNRDRCRLPALHCVPLAALLPCAHLLVGTTGLLTACFSTGCLPAKS
jgi:hypothetical protein